VFKSSSYKLFLLYGAIRTENLVSDNVKAYLFLVASTGGPVLELCQQLPSGNSSETLSATCRRNVNTTDEIWLHSYTSFIAATFIEMSGVQMPYYELI